MAFNGRFVLNMAHFAARQGVNFEELIKASGHSVAELEQEDFQVENEVYNRVIELACERTGDPFLGLHAGENQNLTALGLIAQITHSASTVKEALEFCCQFANLGCSVLPMYLEEAGDYYKVLLRPNPVWSAQSPTTFKHTVDGVLTFSIREFHSLTRDQHHPIGIHLPWAAPTDTSEYNRVFRCPVHFQKGEIAMLLSKAQVEDKVVTSDYKLLRILVKHAEEKSAALQSQMAFTTQVKQSVIQMVRPQFPNIEQVAFHLNMSLRTFQRKLKAEGYSFKQLMDELKKEFALGYLQQDHLSISEIAYLLNYAEVSTFSRSFKRWTGHSPQTYRKQINA
ncbi:MAG: AraC family transcriptional regulator ligand-binding domain-containing protein [Bacteroidota bacterium]